MKAILYRKSVPRYLVVRLMGRRWHWLYTSALSPIKLASIAEPLLPSANPRSANPRSENWTKIETHLCGICGSDLATITAKGSPYFSPFTSTPFVLGHEVVGKISEVGSAVNGFVNGDRVVLKPVLSCEIRGIDQKCSQCVDRNFSNCENITSGSISAGIQTGYCSDTGGGWSSFFLAHESQLHKVPDQMSDELAVLIEPFACALHGVLKANFRKSDEILIIGAGTIGLLTLAAIRSLGNKNRILMVAKHPHQQEFARKLGADEIFYSRSSKGLYEKFSDLTGAKIYQPELGKPVPIGGVNITFDCIGSSNSIDDSLRFTSAQGQVILVGMPGIPKNVDWTSLWHKELKLIGAYTYGFENYDGKKIDTFELGMEKLWEMRELLLPLVSRSFRLENYREAIQSALHTSKSKSIKTVFDLR